MDLLISMALPAWPYQHGLASMILLARVAFKEKQLIIYISPRLKAR
jgi:hypothetical protein